MLPSCATVALAAAGNGFGAFEVVAACGLAAGAVAQY
jgi:hypothetical protein